MGIEHLTAENQSLHLIVKSSKYPQVLSKLGPYVTVDTELEQKMNVRFTECPDLLKIVPHVFNGGILQTKKLTILIMSCEVYSRDGSIDVHLESKSSSYPEELNKENRRYPRITTSVIYESDGGKETPTLIIGTREYNLSISASLILYPQLQQNVSVGPSCNSSLEGETLNNLEIEEKQCRYL